MSNEIADIEVLVRSRVPLIFIESIDVERAEALAHRLATRCDRPLYRWSLARALERINGGGARMGHLADAPSVLAHIASLRSAGLYLMLDLHQSIADPEVVSQLRHLATVAETTPHCLLIVAPELSVPPELRTSIARFELSLPNAEELRVMILSEAEEWGQSNQKRVQARGAAIEALVQNLSGISLPEARRLVRNAIYDDGILDEDDLPRVMDAKYSLLDQGGVLSFELDTAKMADVAGLSRLKTWLKQRKSVFTAASPPVGLDPPKGLLLLGVQGGGKSLAAKAVAGAWQLPLLRLDFGTLYNKYYGETERNLRDSLKTAGLMAPCVLWIDEIEKGLSTDQDGGPGKRILGTLLTWMAERTDRVFLVATANDIESLPPELMRKGRFDEIFFVDLPSAEVRAVIFEIHLRKRNHDVGTFDSQVLADASVGFTGAEIEQAVVSAMYRAHADGVALITDHVLDELAQTRPLSVVMAEKVAHLRAWASSRTVPAD